ncbi:hypothetical protein BDD12DRAFT_202642 [Trichophaea hybrida]|nr:hypothetical protein BDD12DRAFT_202642 [Trichophaea hybrida]
MSTGDDNAGGTAEAGASQKLKSTADKPAEGPLAFLEWSTKNAGGIKVAHSVLAAIITAGAFTGKYYYDIWATDSAFKKGSVKLIGSASCDFQLDRKELTEEIKYLLDSTHKNPVYGLIFGPHGTGKSTLVRILAHDLGGAVYVGSDTDSDAEDKILSGFTYAFAKAFNSSRLNLLSFSTINVFNSSELNYEDIMNDFRAAAARYKAKTGGIGMPILIIDNVNILAKVPGLLTNLQSIAKGAAIDGKFRIVFVTSDGPSVQDLRGKARLLTGRCFY